MSFLHIMAVVLLVLAVVLVAMLVQLWRWTRVVAWGWEEVRSALARSVPKAGEK